MMATDNHELNNIKDKDAPPTKRKPARNKRIANVKATETATTNGHAENGENSIRHSPTSSPAKSAAVATTDDDSEFGNAKISEGKTRIPSDQLDEPLTPVVSSQSTSKPSRGNSSKFTQITLTTVTDEENDDEERDERKKIQSTDEIIIDSDGKPNIMVQSTTSTVGENDVVEIHEFTLTDIDAYLDIYFETLNNRLRHYIGDSERIQQFRQELKTRISSNENAREYQNVLLGKIHGDVVAAVTLIFPGETTTIHNDNLLPQSNSCLTSFRRWLTRQANYMPKNMDECYIEMIGVKSSCRSNGIGTAMLECVEDFARQSGAHHLTVHVNSVRLRNYFQRFGFQFDPHDNSGFWKWMIEHESIQKMSKILTSSDNNADQSFDNASNFLDESMADSELK